MDGVALFLWFAGRVRGFVRVEGLGLILFFEVGTVAFEGEPELTYQLLHIAADAEALFVGFGGEAVGMFIMLSCVKVIRVIPGRCFCEWALLGRY